MSLLSQKPLYYYCSLPEDSKNPLSTLHRHLRSNFQRGMQTFSLVDLANHLPEDLTLRQSLLLEAVEMDPFHSKERLFDRLLKNPESELVQLIYKECRHLDLYPHQVEDSDLAWVTLLKGLLRPGANLLYIERGEIPVANHQLWYQALVQHPRPLMVHSPYCDYWRAHATHEIILSHQGQTHEFHLRPDRIISESTNIYPYQLRRLG